MRELILAWVKTQVATHYPYFLMLFLLGLVAVFLAIETREQRRLNRVITGRRP